MTLSIRKKKEGFGHHEDWIATTWSPVTGCTKCSAACVHCYALDRIIPWQLRLKKQKYRNGGRVTLHPGTLDEPRHKRKGQDIFVCSMSDLFHKKVPTSFIKKVFKVMNECPQHNFRLITKRSERMAEIATDLIWTPNIWAGVTIEHPDYLHRADELRKVPASVLFIYCEPLLGSLKRLNLKGISTIVVGGESGPEAREMKKKWVLELRDKCREKGTALFFKQWGDSPLSGPEDRNNQKQDKGGCLLDGEEYKERLVFNSATGRAELKA